MFNIVNTFSSTKVGRCENVLTEKNKFVFALEYVNATSIHSLSVNSLLFDKESIFNIMQILNSYFNYHTRTIFYDIFRKELIKFILKEDLLDMSAEFYYFHALLNEKKWVVYNESPNIRYQIKDNIYNSKIDETLRGLYLIPLKKDTYTSFKIFEFYFKILKLSTYYIEPFYDTLKFTIQRPFLDYVFSNKEIYRKFPKEKDYRHILSVSNVFTYPNRTNIFQREDLEGIGGKTKIKRKRFTIDYFDLINHFPYFEDVVEINNEDIEYFEKTFLDKLITFKKFS